MQYLSWISDIGWYSGFYSYSWLNFCLLLRIDSNKAEYQTSWALYLLFSVQSLGTQMALSFKLASQRTLLNREEAGSVQFRRQLLVPGATMYNIYIPLSLAAGFVSWNSYYCVIRECPALVEKLQLLKSPNLSSGSHPFLGYGYVW